MKKFISLLLGIVFVGSMLAQSNVSEPMDFYIKKDVIPPLLRVVPNSLQFVDQNDNNVIDAGEISFIRFEVVNEGAGDAHGCEARVTMTGSTKGVTVKNISLPIIPRRTSKVVEIPIKANSQTQTGNIEFAIEVYEPNGFGPDLIKLDLGTGRMRTPYVQVASYKIVGDKGGKLNRRQTFKLQVIVQNTDQGTAENVKVALKLPENVSWMGGSQEMEQIAELKANETRTYEYELMANQNAADEIHIAIDLNERTGRYAKDGDIPLTFGQYVGSAIAMKLERNDEEVEIQKVSLHSDVDVNIPVTTAKNTNTFVLIIANENYTQVASVPYALNDGQIFRQYCIKTLGINERHIKYFPDATKNQIEKGIDWLADAAEINENPKFIFYYAGHGYPDEVSKLPYLLPIDGYGSDVKTGVKIDDIYTRLGKMEASQITIFMDACFSGSKREQGMLVSARGVALKAKSGIPQGNMVVFSAAEGDQTAYPYVEQQHGIFTYYLLKKLQETKGEVTLQTLRSYIKTKVQSTCFDLNDGKKQTPSITPSSSIGDDWQNWKLK